MPGAHKCWTAGLCNPWKAGFGICPAKSSKIDYTQQQPSPCVHLVHISLNKHHAKAQELLSSLACSKLAFKLRQGLLRSTSVVLGMLSFIPRDSVVGKLPLSTAGSLCTISRVSAIPNPGFPLASAGVRIPAKILGGLARAAAECFRGDADSAA